MIRRDNVRLIKQKTGSDCAVCSMAMLTGIPYKKVYQILEKDGSYVEGKGMQDTESALLALGLRREYKRHPRVRKAFVETYADFKHMWKPWEISPQYYRQQLWGRRALLSVPSLNNPGGSHMIYWHYDRIYDPSPKKTYTKFDDLEPTHIYVFMEN